jgi:hypothetical protein
MKISFNDLYNFNYIMLGNPMARATRTKKLLYYFLKLNINKLYSSQKRDS